MTTQQKIEFYISKGFTVKIQWICPAIDSIIYSQSKDGKFIGKNIDGGFERIWGGDLDLVGNITPIPPKPYEFKENEKAMVLTGSSKGIIGEVDSYCDGDVTLWISEEKQLVKHWYELAPALPEDEECEVVEVVEWDACPSLHCCKDKADVPIVWSFTKPDGKKLKIKVIKK
jgi:hypothetical protein